MREVVARMVELVDTTASQTVDRKVVRVRIPLPARELDPSVVHAGDSLLTSPQLRRILEAQFAMLSCWFPPTLKKACGDFRGPSSHLRVVKFGASTAIVLRDAGET